MTIGMKTVSIKTIIASAAVAVGLMAATPALASGGAAHPRSGGFSFDGPFGTYDQGQLQRGYKVYHEVCAAC
ncbi:cytochrome c1, partial [Brevundimonas nasdae]|uniref:cytochrome c1 n=1 Tax=Brevundimonas nasdae TaxID=172043 RepID=UPI0028965742